MSWLSIMELNPNDRGEGEGKAATAGELTIKYKEKFFKLTNKGLI